MTYIDEPQWPKSYPCNDQGHDNILYSKQNKSKETDYE